jgi:hypothetical protein
VGVATAVAVVLVPLLVDLDVAAPPLVDLDDVPPLVDLDDVVPLVDLDDVPPLVDLDDVPPLVDLEDAAPPVDEDDVDGLAGGRVEVTMGTVVPFTGATLGVLVRE